VKRDEKMPQMYIRLKPVPLCPECLEPMVLRRPPKGKTWRPFWGCSDYPTCKGTLQIKDNGEPDEDEFEVDV
jgi:ssDNA-binding Zn-finger/Zn-ribbon topoisomerase 1